jgi:hypothetical protein
MKPNKEPKPTFIRISKVVRFVGGSLQKKNFFFFILFQKKKKNKYLEFCLSLVSFPVKTTIPIIQSVFFKTQPRRRICVFVKGRLFSSDLWRKSLPSKLYKSLFGRSHSTYPSQSWSCFGCLKWSVFLCACLTFKFVSL